MDNGKNQLLEYVARIHPAQEFSPIDLEPGGAHALPGGFAITANPFAVSTQVDPNRLTLFGPLNTAVAVPTLEMFGGRVVIRGIALLQAIARLVETGPPVWSSRIAEVGEWWKTQIAGCEPFMVPEPAPKTREEMERFIDIDPACQRVLPTFIESVNAGSGLVSDADLREFIERATAGPEAAIEFYTRRRDGRLGIAPPAPAKARRKAAASEVTV